MTIRRNPATDCWRHSRGSLDLREVRPDRTCLLWGGAGGRELPCVRRDAIWSAVVACELKDASDAAKNAAKAGAARVTAAAPAPPAPRALRSPTARPVRRGSAYEQWRGRRGARRACSSRPRENPIRAGPSAKIVSRPRSDARFSAAFASRCPRADSRVAPSRWSPFHRPSTAIGTVPVRAISRTGTIPGRRATST